MIVTILGSSANQTSSREGVALLIEDGSPETRLLIDAGPGIVAALQRCNRKASEIDNVLLTHTHGDHILGFAYFAWQRFYECMGKEPPASDLTVYGLPNAVSMAEHMVEGCYGANPFPFKINYVSIEPRSTFQIGCMSLETCEADHTTPAISCSVINGSKKIAFSSDTLPTNSFSSIATHSNLLLHEGMWTESLRQLANRAKHATALDAGNMATQTNSQQLVLLHIFPAYFGREAELLIEAHQAFSGPISVPHDGTMYII